MPTVSSESFSKTDDARVRRSALFGLVAQRPCWVPTWRGWLVVFLLSLLLFTGIITGVHPFLAVNDPRPGGNLVIEGWAADAAFQQTIAEYERHPYERLISTGGPLEKGAPLIGYETLAEVGAATFRKLRPDLRELYAVPAPKVRQDRTYASAVALKEWLRERGQLPAKINLVSGGPHSRRSRLLFQKAFGADAEIGIIAMEDDTYDAKRWWTSSQGFRIVTSEIIAYLYARFFFWP
ncbi:MAG: YdcF family protein [Verrucomicrobiaceae bacterium]|nr:MAG: YdcF family protein [Verrucomicrobiaceae bacterium]